MPVIGHKIETTTDNFSDLVKEDCLLVDKTLMIKEFWDGKKVSLITRPRRFGKTLNLSMLHYFFSAEISGDTTFGLFDKLAIAKVDDGEFLKTHQGQYPVIFITFKDLKEPSFASAVSRFRTLIQELYREHEILLETNTLSIADKIMFQNYLIGTVNDETLQDALKFLSEFLHKIHNKKVIILIDEYDTPITVAYQYNYLDELSRFMRNLFSAALKTNRYLEKGLMTGILRVSKNNMLSGLNNLELYTVIEQPFATYFGFTEGEIKELVHYTQNDVCLADMRSYYNGYLIGGNVIYNPWSSMTFLDKKELVPYWVLTSNDSLLKDSFLNGNDEIKVQLSDLMQGKSIAAIINTNLRYEDLVHEPDALWTLLLFCGYLTVESKQQTLERLTCQLTIPNKEILAQYRSIFCDWLTHKLNKSNYASLLSSLTTGNVDVFTCALGDYLMQSLSYHDVHGKKSEKLYHGFVAGLIASIRDTHWVNSNRESGRGRYDLILIPKDPQHTRGIIIEFKKTSEIDTLQTIAETALNQINSHAYATELKTYTHIKQILKIGLAFCDKAVLAAHQTENLATQQNSLLTFSQVVQREEEDEAL